MIVKCINPTSTLTKGKQYQATNNTHKRWSGGKTLTYKLVNDNGRTVNVTRDKFIIIG